jgi:hypothetical protein
MHIHNTHTSSVVETSEDGRRITERIRFIQERPEVPAYFQDDPVTNAAVEDEDFSYTLHDDSLPAQEDDLPTDGIAFQARKRYENSVSFLFLSPGHAADICFQDNPFKIWEQSHRDEYLDEALRLEGRGGPVNYAKCGGCDDQNPTYRCAEQECHGGAMFCQKCTVARHEALPLHWIEASHTGKRCDKN